MPQSPLRLIKRCAEHRVKEEINSLPIGLRGIYVLFKHRPRKDVYDVVYIGMARSIEGKRQGGIRGRLKSHRRKKAGMWTHFSVFEVWDNIRDEEVEELEGLFRHIYRKDERANSLNKQKSYKKLKSVHQRNLDAWE